MRARAVVGALLVVAVAPAWAGCTAAGTASDPTPSESADATPLHVTVPDGSWLDPAYSDGLGSPLSVSGDFCALSRDDAVIITSQYNASTFSRDVVGWDVRTGAEIWRQPDNHCLYGDSDGDVVYASRMRPETAIDAIDMASGEVASTWDPGPGTLLWRGTRSGVAMVLHSEEDASGTSHESIEFVDAADGTALWSFDPGEPEQKVDCEILADNATVACQRLGDSGWREIRVLRDGALVGERIEGTGAVIRLSDGYAFHTGVSVDLRKEDGSDLVDVTSSWPSLAAPAGALLSLEDAQGWAGVHAVDHDGVPVAVGRTADRGLGDIAVATDEDLPGWVVGLTDDGGVLAVLTIDETRSVSLTDRDGAVIGEPVDVSAVTQPDVLVIHGSVIVRDLSGTGAGATMVIPAA